jgi:H+/gluconate symporter-like permease
MIQFCGIKEALEGLMQGKAFSGALLILLAFSIAVVMKIAQGSGTVSMITTAGIMNGIIGDQVLPFHKIYVFAAIGFGSLTVSWMNDSGFWIVSKMSGFTEKETLKTWTLLLGVLSLLGLLEVLVLSQILPLHFLPD